MTTENLINLDNKQKAIFIKNYFEANGLKADKVIRAKLDDGFFVYHKYGMESKAYKPHKIISETENMKIVQTQPYKLKSTFVGDDEYIVDSLQIAILEGRNMAGIKGQFVLIESFNPENKKAE